MNQFLYQLGFCYCYCQKFSKTSVFWGEQINFGLVEFEFPKEQSYPMISHQIHPIYMHSHNYHSPKWKTIHIRCEMHSHLHFHIKDLFKNSDSQITCHEENKQIFTRWVENKLLITYGSNRNSGKKNVDPYWVILSVLINQNMNWYGPWPPKKFPNSSLLYINHLPVTFIKQNSPGYHFLDIKQFFLTSKWNFNWMLNTI